MDDINWINDSGMTPLEGAIKLGGTPERVNDLIRRGAAVNILDNRYRNTPLMWAADIGIRWNQIRPAEIVKILIKAGSPLNHKNRDGDTAVHYASSSAPMPLKALLDAGAEVNVKNNDGDTPLIIAAKKGNWSNLLLLMSAGGDIHVTDENGNTLLHWCLFNDEPSWEVFELLLASGIDFNAKRPDGLTPLMCAVKHPGLFSFLLNHGAEINNKQRGGVTELMAAASARAVGPLKELIEHGADIHARNDYRGETALDCAKNLESIVALHEAGAPLTESLLVHWCKYGNDDSAIVEYIIDSGVDVNSLDSEGNTPLIHATNYKGQFEVIKLLINKGAKVNIKGADGTTPLMRSMNEHYQPEIVCLLLENGAKDEDVADFEILKLLLIVPGERRIELANDDGDFTKEKADFSKRLAILVNSDIDFNAFGEDGHILHHPLGGFGTDDLLLYKLKALHGVGCEVASFAFMSESSINCVMYNADFVLIFKHLIELGLDVNSKFEDKTLLSIAVENKQLEVVKFLIKSGAEDNWEDNNPLAFAYDTKMIAAYVELGADLSAKRSAGSEVSFGNEFLFGAVTDSMHEENLHLLKFLLNAGVDVNIVDGDGLNALARWSKFHSIFGWRKFEMFQVLLDAGADVNSVVDSEGLTILMAVACRPDDFESSTEIIDLLITSGADVDAVDKYGKTVSDWANVAPEIADKYWPHLIRRNS